MSSAAFAYPQKSAEAFRTISEVSQELDVPQHVLRFWESRFAQIRPVKRAGVAVDTLARAATPPYGCETRECP